MGRIGLERPSVPLAVIDELVRLIADLVDGDRLAERTEAEEKLLAQRIAELSPDASWSDHIYHSSEFYRSDNSLDVEAVVQRITGPQPVIFGDPPTVD